MPRRKTGSGFSHKSHYEENKEDILQKRRSRYNDDPQYREQVKQRALKSYYKSKSENNEAMKVSDDTYEINGLVYRTSGYIAKACEITASLVNYYHEKGYIPNPKPVAGYTSRKLYRDELAKAIIDSINKYNKDGSLSSTDMYANVVTLIGRQKIKEYIGHV